MLRKPTVMLDNLILSLSDSLDLIHPSAVDHQQRVAYIVLRLAKLMGCSLREQADLMYASVLHDIGVLSVEEKIRTMDSRIEDDGRHAEAGAELLRHIPVFELATQLVRFHHRPWGTDAEWGDAPSNIRVLVNMIHLADYVERTVQRDADILGQAKAICGEVTRLAGKDFSPEIVNLFLDLSARESFWLDIASHRIYSALAGMVQWPRMELDLDGLEQIAKMFSRMVDFRSRFTSTHSIGVGSVARELARRMHFSEKECRLMLIAGYLHDLGKVAVPNSLLDKPGKLESSEFDVVRQHTYHTYNILTTIGGFEEISKWAAFHHERLNGKGYPFHMRGEEIPLGSRIMSVADVFTALAESRSYRKGTKGEETLSVLRSLVSSGSLEESIVAVLTDGYDEIDGVRAQAQALHAVEYERLMYRRAEAGTGPVNPSSTAVGNCRA